MITPGESDGKCECAYCSTADTQRNYKHHHGDVNQYRFRLGLHFRLMWMYPKYNQTFFGSFAPLIFV